MASIQIRADIVISSCDKMINEINKSYTLMNHPEMEAEYKEQAKLLKEVRRRIQLIKELAEYALKPEKKGDMLKSNSDAMIIIDHNDFNLIGEYLTSTDDKGE